MRSLEVVRGGPLTTVQDLGRAGLASVGVGRSGAADRPSHRLANRLVGNAEGAATLELTLGGLALRARGAGLVALTGAPCPVTVAGRGASMNSPLPVRDGDEVVVGAPTCGLRTYLAVRGGVDVPAVLGSRATDLLAGLGPPRVEKGHVVPVGDDTAEPPPAVDVAPVRGPNPGEVVLRILLGPRHDWFADDVSDVLTAEPYEVTDKSNRIGLRLAGAELTRVRGGELPSEGMEDGALQVPPSGQPVLFLADHPVTGGYPVVGVVLAEDVPHAAQARPGQSVRFVVVPGAALEP
ncbi:MAG: biotin-dependent carboxyltransferase family protein [Actinomycetes bacterium]